MALEQQNTQWEFDAMLRRHLKRGGAPVAACAGFDADAAATYLERLLNRAAQSRFEAHLAGCVACRRYVIELSRLMRLLPQAETKPATPVAAPQPWTETLKGWRAVAWFEPSVWRWQWAAASAAAVVLTVLSVQTFRQSASPAPTSASLARQPSIAVAQPTGGTAADTLAAGSADADSLPQTPVGGAALFPLTEPESPVAKERAESGATRANSPVPIPNVPPSAGRVADGLIVPGDKAVAITVHRPEPPAAVPPPAPEPPAGLANLAARRQLTGQRSISFALEDAAAPADNQTVNLKPSSALVDELIGYQAPAAERTQEANLLAKAEAKKKEAAREESRLRTIIQSAGKTFVPTRADERDRKDAEERKTPAPSEDELRPLLRKINNKTFSKFKRVWVDQEYKPEAKLPVVRLIFGSKEFQQVLIGTPSLKPFFDLGQVVFVWKGKVFEITRP